MTKILEEMMTFLARDGAVFEASIRMQGASVVARYEVRLDVGDLTKSSSDFKEFSDRDTAIRWIDAEAASRGFSKYPLDAG